MILIGNIKSVVYRAILSFVSGISWMLQKLPQYRNGHVEVDEWWFGSAVTCLTGKPFVARGCVADPQRGARSTPCTSTKRMLWRRKPKVASEMSRNLSYFILDKNHSYFVLDKKVLRTWQKNWQHLFDKNTWLEIPLVTYFNFSGRI